MTKYCYVNCENKRIETLTAGVIFVSVLTFLNHIGSPSMIHVNQVETQVNHVALLKVHKTGGTTIVSILVNYAQKNNLTSAVPRTGHWLGYPRQFIPDVVKQIPNVSKFDVLWRHAIYSKQMRSFMPNDTKYITMIRDPVSQIASYVSYFTGDEPNITYQSLAGALKSGRFRNPQMFDLGYRPDDIYTKDTPWNSTQRSVGSKSYAEQYILKMDTELDLVMINEYFDESLIILRDLFHWQTDDIVYFSKNVRTNKKIDDKQMDVKLKRLVRELNSADVHLYDHFSKKIKLHIQENESYLKAEVTKLRKTIQEWKNYCIDGSIAGAQIQDPRFRPVMPPNVHDIIGYKLTREGLRDERCISLSTIYDR